MTRILTAALIALTLTVATCGDDDGAEPSPASSPAASATASPSPSPVATPETRLDQLTYIEREGAIRVVAADGSGGGVLVAEPCSGMASAQVSSLRWSNTGDHLAYVCAGSTVLDARVEVVDSAGTVIQELDAAAFRWSPDGARIAVAEYVSTEDPAARIQIVRVETGEETLLTDAGILLDWLGKDRILVGLNVQAGDLAHDYDPYLFDLTAGASAPFDGFEQTDEFWLAPDGETAIILGEYDEEMQGLQMLLYDIASGSRTEIRGAAIGYGSEFIPDELLAFTPDSSAIFWINGNIYNDSPLFTADLRAAEPVAEVAGVADRLGAVSSSGRVAYMEWSEGGVARRLVAADPGSGEAVTIAPGSDVWPGPLAWRSAQQ